jgi:hypothetical protein
MLGSFSLLGVFFFVLVAIETKGKSMGEIQKTLDGEKTPQ